MRGRPRHWNPAGCSDRRQRAWGPGGEARVSNRGSSRHLPFRGRQTRIDRADRRATGSARQTGTKEAQADMTRRRPLAALVAGILAAALPAAGIHAQAPPPASPPPVSTPAPSTPAPPPVAASPQTGQSAPGAAAPAGAPTGRPAAAPRLPAEITTIQYLEIPDRRFQFKATAGAIPLYDANDGSLQAEVAYIAYVKSDGGPNRPVTFAVNGGPGSSSAYLQLGAIGPWRLPLDHVTPSSAPTTVPNAETWLDFTDLV